MSSILPFSPIRRVVAIGATLAVTVALLPTLLAAPAAAFPVADDSGSYTLCGRVFPDPQAYWPSPSQAPGQSPWAKGNGECR
ncbi:MAG: hypothetical protein KY437_08700, partial [Actinobacteria bacterium]|nr:hypothetical protein [Actinomycetota bacterium]